MFARKHKPVTTVCTLALVFVAMAGGAVRAQTQGIVYRFASAPLTSPSIYVSLRRPAVGDAVGKAVAFNAKVRVLGAGGTRGVFTADPVAPDALEALRGDVVPPTTGFRRFLRPAINSAGDVVWSARVAGGGEGVFRTGPAPVALTGDVVPALGTGTLKRFGLPVIADSGEVVFHASIFGGPLVGSITVDSGIFRCVGGDGNCTSGTGTLEALVLVGDTLTDRPGRMFCDLLPGTDASVFGVAFKGITKLDCADVAEPSLVGVFRLPWGGLVETLALQEEASEPSPILGGTVYSRFPDVPAISNLGSVTFLATTGGVSRRDSIYLCTTVACPAVPAAIAVTDGGLDMDGNVLSRLGAARVSDVDDISFRAHAALTARTSGVFVWRSATATVERIAARKDPVPSEPSEIYLRVDRPWISPAGRIAFRAKTKAPSGFGRWGIYLVE